MFFENLGNAIENINNEFCSVYDNLAKKFYVKLPEKHFSESLEIKSLLKKEKGTIFA